MKEAAPSYTNIQHGPRIKYGLSNNDYCIAALVYHMSNNPNAPIKGWCMAGKETIGGYFGISRQTVHGIIAKLESKGLIERQEQTGFLRTSKIWYQEFECLTPCKESLHPVKKPNGVCKESLQDGVKKVDTTCKESLHYNNTITIVDNNTDNTPAERVPDFKDFWEAYGRKIGFKKCQQKWKNLTARQKILCMAHVPKYVAATPDVTFRKYPLTYLNGEHWLDELPDIKPTLKPQTLTTQKTVEIWHG